VGVDYWGRDRAAEQDIRRRIPPEPKEFILEAQPEWHFVNRRMRERKRLGY
jgi:hypothetical protein